MRSRPRTAPLLACAAVLAAGCGNDRIDPGSVRLVPSQTAKALNYPKEGVRVELPRNMAVTRTPAPGVLRASLGEGFVSVFAYPRKEQLPRNAKDLGDARRRLVDTAKKRVRNYRLVSSRTTRIGGQRAIELLGDQTISKRRLRIRSLHVFRGKAEYVLEVAGPREGFRAFDAAITSRVRRTLKVTGTVRPRR